MNTSTTYVHDGQADAPCRCPKPSELDICGHADSSRDCPRHNAMAYEDWVYEEGADEGPTCPICDGLGHGVPGTRPCPLEDDGRYDPNEERF